MTPNIKQPWLDIPATGPLLRPDAAAEYLSISVNRLYVLGNTGVLPRPLKIGTRSSGIPRPWLDAVIAARAAESIAA